MDINGTEMEFSELINPLRRHIEKETRQIIHAIINCNLRLCNMTFPEWIRSHYHDIYHLCYNKIRCNQCTLQYILPEHRQLQPRHLHSLFAEDLSNPRHISGINIRSKDININEIDIVLAGCLLDHCCDSVYWYYSLNLLGKTLEQFLDENKSEIYDLVDTSHVKSRGNRGITTDDTSQVKYRGNRGITTDEWLLLFGSDTNVFHDKDKINHVSAKSNITMQHLYEANTLLPRNLLNSLCPFKKKVDRILYVANMAINKKCDWINIDCKEEIKRTTDEILSWLQCINIMTEQGVYSNGPEMFTENTDLNHVEKQFLEQSMFDHDAGDDKSIDEYQQLDTENHQYSKYNDGNLVFRCEDINDIPSDTCFKTPQQRLASFIHWPLSTRYWPVQLAEAGFVYTDREWVVRCFMCNHISSVNTWIPQEKPEEAHARLNPTCKHVVDMNYKTCQTYKTVTNHISRKQLPDANITCAKSLDMYNQKVKNYVDDSQNVCSNGMNDKVGNQSTAIEADDSDSTIEVVHLHEATKEVDCNVPASDNTPGVVSTTEHNLVVSNDNGTACNGTASESTNTKQINYQENTVKFKYPAFESFRLRMKSFSDWPYTAKQRPDVLANAGYFYTGDADIVRCFCCDLGVAEWADTDDVWVEHARHSSTCWFLKTQKGEEFIKDVQVRWKKIYNPKYAVFEDRDSRLATYRGVWRPDIEQTPDILTDAGFFYTGVDDVVRCHCCDGGLCNWESVDDPWEEHARWFPFCKYIIKMKGKEYIDSIRRKYEVIERNEELVIESEEILANHPFVQQLADLSFQTEDIKTAMRHFTQNEGHSNFTMEDLIEIIVEKNDQLQSAFSDCCQRGGLVNPSGKNLCFANALLQCLRVADINRILQYHTPCTGNQTCFTCCLRDFMTDIPNNAEPLCRKMTSFWKDYKVGQQQDAHELLHMMMEEIQQKCFGSEDICNEKRVFYGQEKSVVICKGCQAKSSTIDVFSSISVSIEKHQNITQAIEGYFKDEEIEWKCDVCKKKTWAIKKTTLKEIPKNIVFQLQRFGGDGRKIMTRVDLHFDISLRTYVEEHKVLEDKAMLFGVIVHKGNTLTNGHYYAFIQFGTRWYLFDDFKVKQVSTQSLKDIEGQPYLLFYRALPRQS